MKGSSKGSSHRAEQVAETIRQVLAGIFLREGVRDPRVGSGLIVTGVLVSKDLSFARVLVTVPGEPEVRARALEGLQSAAGFLRGRVAQALSTRIVPQLKFELDRGREHAARIDELLGEIRRESEG